MTIKNYFVENAPLLRVWNYLWSTYRENGGVPKDVSDAISLIQARIAGAR